MKDAAHREKELLLLLKKFLPAPPAVSPAKPPPSDATKDSLAGSSKNGIGNDLKKNMLDSVTVITSARKT
ncbi:hypothetical protein [Geminisphaera colitermitum]|uniref:hypothetical protein n=1 Tax=Geminisphaera colitermitum TaxID=1148786 RepID=UPI0018E3A100|nr:hypothetical protein [Geminisphaera colitermitum]